jgi:hypothetical protein
MFKTVSKPLAHLNFLSGVNCYDIGSKIDTPGDIKYIVIEQIHVHPLKEKHSRIEESINF